MFVIDTGKRIYGPFKTANDASKWADKTFYGVLSPDWKIIPLHKPS